jgi:hypothetical protein
MLEPQSRTLLIDALRPPAGHRLSFVIGTTYSLDLTALLSLLLALGDADAPDEAGSAELQTLALLKQNKDRIAIFYQAGQIAVPRTPSLLNSLLEECVFECSSPLKKGSFHPKVWILRFEAVSVGGPPFYRLLIATRNLTFDRSWDTLLAMDGFDSQSAPVRQNDSLCRFIGGLPDLCGSLPRPTLQNLKLMEEEVGHVEFVSPDGLTLAGFWPMGQIQKPVWPFGEGRYDRLLVISPFLDERLLARLRGQVTGSDHWLVSRPESLAAIPASGLEGFAPKVLSVEADVGDVDAEAEGNAVSGDSVLRGLHAKLYVAEKGNEATIWTGSANATDKGFFTNVEFLAELCGPKSRCGIDAILGREDLDARQATLRSLLDDYDPGTTSAHDPIDDRLDRQLSEAQREISALRWVAVAHPDNDGLYQLELIVKEGSAWDLPSSMRAVCWPITRTEKAGATTLTPTAGAACVFEKMRVEDLTAFYALRLTIRLEGRERTKSFVRFVPLEGAPKDRLHRVTAALLENKQKVADFLWMLIDPEATARHLASHSASVANKGSASSAVARPLGAFLESVMRALDRDPERFDQLVGVVAELQEQEKTRNLLPEGFNEIWQPILEARKRQRS